MPTEGFSRFYNRSSSQMLKAMGFAGQYIETSQGKLHYYQAKGSGKLPPMVVIHGFGTQAPELYRLLLRLRRVTRWIIAPDLPMHGFSDTPRDGIHPQVLDGMFFEALDQILAGQEPAILFGNSLGGLACLRYYLHKPKNVRLMVLSSPGGAGVADEHFAKVRQIFGEISQQKPDDLVERIYTKPPLYRWFVAKELQMRFAKPHLRELMAYFKPEYNFTHAEMQQIDIPTLVIWGRQDRILENQLDFFKQTMPKHVRFLEPAHFSHTPYIEHSLELAHQIYSFARLHCAEGDLPQQLSQA